MQERMRQVLTECGMDVAETESRIAGDDDFLLKMLRIFVEDDSVKQLCAAMQEEKAEEAFAIAHKLKGAVNNFSLYLLAESLEPLVESLRISCRENLPIKKEAFSFCKDLENHFGVLRKQVLQLVEEEK